MIKRRLTTGEFESDWLDITEDVKKFGVAKYEADSRFLSRFRFPTISMTLNNDQGQYNSENSIFSYWHGYLPRPRTLVKIEAGFITETDNGDGTWTIAEVPSSDPVIYTGIIGGDMTENDNNEVVIQVMPLAEVFRQYPARNLTGYNNSLTASDFITMLRDQQDSGGNYIFRPFFQNTTTGWSIQATTIEYSNLNTSTNEEIRDMTTWEVIEKLSESESYMPIVTRDGRFRFVSREANTTTAAFQFNGLNVYDYTHGHTIKDLNFIGPRMSKFYTRVAVRWAEPDTTTSIEVVESTLTVNPVSASWKYGQKTFEIDNRWIPSSSVAQSIASAIFTDYSALKREIDFTTSFIPNLDLLDQVTVSYDSSAFQSGESLWDVGTWADSASGASTGSELIWDANDGLAIYLLNEEFTLISVAVDLDKMECRFIGRET